MISEKTLKLMSILLIIGGLFWIYVIFVDGIYINKPITFETNIMQTAKDEYCPGEMVTAYWSWCKEDTRIATISWSLVNSTITSYTPRTSGMIPGQREGVVDIQRIPTTAEPGLDYHFEGNLTYPRLFGDISIPRTTNEFKIVECEK